MTLAQEVLDMCEGKGVVFKKGDKVKITGKASKMSKQFRNVTNAVITRAWPNNDTYRVTFIDDAGEKDHGHFKGGDLIKEAR